MADLVVTLSLNDVWVRGQTVPGGWKLLGIYTSQREADGACELSNEFIGPVPINKPWFSQGNWPMAYYPRRQV